MDYTGAGKIVPKSELSEGKIQNKSLILIPKNFEESQNIDFLFFIDAANLWGVDYDNDLDDDGTLRSSTGIALDWFTPVGPLNFSLSLN